MSGWCKDWLPVVWSVLPVYLLILLGALLRRMGVLRREHDDGVMHVVFHVMYPCFILDNMLGRAVLRSSPVVGWGVSLGFGLAVIGIGIGWMVGKSIGLARGAGLRTFSLSSGLQNYGYTAIPVIAVLWPSRDGVLGVLFVHNLGMELAVWTLGVMLMSGSGKVPWRQLVNGPVFAVVAGLFLVAVRWDNYITGPPREMMRLLGAGAFPVAILLIGAAIFDLALAERPSVRILLGGGLVRLLLAPAVYLAAAKMLPLIDEMRRVLVVQAAMPAAMTPILLAKLYGGRPAIPVQIVVVTTVLTVVTLPLIIAIGVRWIGL